MDVKQELRYVIKKHENDKLTTFQTDISSMARDCLREIERLEEASNIAVKAFENLYNQVDNLFIDIGNQWENGMDIEVFVSDLRKLMYGEAKD